MEVTVNDISYEVPFDLALIKLGEFITYQEEYGADIDRKWIALIEKKYTGDTEEIELQKLLDFEELMDTEALAWFSFWTKSDLFEVKKQPFIIPVLEKYRLFRFLLKEALEKESAVFPMEFEWNDETWRIADFKINPASEMSFNEIITSKETMRQLVSIGNGRWHSLLYLCAIFLRKKEEAFEDEMIYEDGERITLLKELPLNIAINVAFFLSNCVSIWRKISASSADQGELINQN
jgi:hypothetical protein